MKTTTRITTGFLFTAVLALSLLASSGAAYAKVDGGGGRAVDRGDRSITFTDPTPPFGTVGITWE
jgi:hypothetical protein